MATITPPQSYAGVWSSLPLGVSPAAYALQMGVPAELIGAFLSSAGTIPGSTPAEVVDRYLRPSKYMTPAEIAQAQATQAALAKQYGPQWGGDITRDVTGTFVPQPQITGGIPQPVGNTTGLGTAYGGSTPTPGTNAPQRTPPNYPIISDATFQNGLWTTNPVSGVGAGSQHPGPLVGYTPNGEPVYGNTPTSPWTQPHLPGTLPQTATTPAPASNPLPGYGISQNLSGFGIPGFETTPMVGGGSWAGTTWSPPPAPNYELPPGWWTPPAAGGTGGTGGTGTGGNLLLGPLKPDGTGVRAEPGNYWVYKEAPGESGGYMQWTQEPDPGYAGGTGGAGGGVGTTTETAGLNITPAVPYATTNYRQTYSGRPAPYANIHDQMGHAMSGITPAQPGFGWANSQALAQMGATGMPPGGWAQMLGYTPGAPNNYGFIGGRPNPYGPGAGALGINPTIG